MNLKKTLTTLIIATLITSAFGQNLSKKDSVSTKKENQDNLKRHSIGASLFMLSNFFPEPADYYLLTYGYQLTKKDRIFVEFNTWKFAEPLGTYNDSEELYPGYVREYGIGVGYQRFFWKGLYSSAQVTPFLKHYMDEDNKKIQNGFKVYMQFLVGYRFEFLKERLYVEPAWAFKYWPVDKNFPDSFAKIEKGSPNTIFEPSLNFGFKF